MTGALADALRALRHELRDGKPAYTVFDDETLRAIVATQDPIADRARSGQRDRPQAPRLYGERSSPSSTPLSEPTDDSATLRSSYHRRVEVHRRAPRQPDQPHLRYFQVAESPRSPPSRPPCPTEPHVFARLGRWCYRHRLAVVLTWLVALILGGAIAAAVGSGFRSEFTLPDTESKRGQDIIVAHFAGVGSGRGGTIVFRAEDGVNDPTVQQTMTTLFDQVGQIPGLTVTSPYSQNGARQISTHRADAGKVAYASDRRAGSDQPGAGQHLPQGDREADPEPTGSPDRARRRRSSPSSSRRARRRSAWPSPSSSSSSPSGRCWPWACPSASPSPASASASIVVTLVSHLVSMPDFTTTLGVMIGLGVGIDYALFIVTRYREGLHHGHSTEEATATAIDTAGRAVLFAGTTVVISLLRHARHGPGLRDAASPSAPRSSSPSRWSPRSRCCRRCSASPATASRSPAGGASSPPRSWRSASSAPASSSPALMVVCLPLAIVVILAGFSVAPLRKEVPAPGAEAVPRDHRLPLEPPHPAPAVAGRHPRRPGVLLVLAIPFLSLRLGFSDEGNCAEEHHTSRPTTCWPRASAPASTAPCARHRSCPSGTDPAAAGPGHPRPSPRTPGVAFGPARAVTEPGRPGRALARDPDHRAAGRSHHQARPPPARRRAARRPRRAPTCTSPSPGQSAANIDFSDYLAARLPWFFRVVLALSFLLLMVVFRSLLVPLKAVVMNLLSIGAAYGLVVADLPVGLARRPHSASVDGGPSSRSCR